MKKFYLFLTVLLLGAGLAEAQETYRFAQKDTSTLYMDIFRSAPGSVTTFQGQEKPTILWVFGGGFLMGERTNDWYRPWFRLLNEQGYTVVTIDYRLGMKNYPMKKGLIGAYLAIDQFMLSQQMGIEDVCSAVSYLAENRASLGIDTDNMVIAGASAGAIISLATEYAIVSGRAEGLPEGFNFKGVMSFAGAIISKSGAPHFKEKPCPILLLHGTADKAVKYNNVSLFGKGLWGSSWLARDWNRKGYDNYWIYRFKGVSHNVALYMEEMWELERQFLEQNVMLGKTRKVDAKVDDPGLPTWNVLEIGMNDIYK